MAHQVNILRLHQEYEGLVWWTYDAAYLHQAAVSGNRCWSRLNPSLHSLATSGKARAAVRCDFCLDSSHASTDCSIWSDPDPEMPSRLKAIESAVLALSIKVAGPSTQSMAGSHKVCHLWNAVHYFKQCHLLIAAYYVMAIICHCITQSQSLGRVTRECLQLLRTLQVRRLL